MTLKLLTAALGLLLAACSTPQTIEGPAAEIRKFTGARTRIVWVQGDGSDPFAGGDALVLMGLDTDDGRNERPIGSERGNYIKPLLTTRGDRVVVSSGAARPGDTEIFIMNFDGSGFRSLGPGFALAVWRDPADDSEWLYVGTDSKDSAVASVSRFKIDNPETRQLVWNKTRVTWDSFQISADGKSAAGLFPWPIAGVAQLPNGELQKLGEGCWTAMVSAGSPVCWYFDGSHRNLTLFDVGTNRRWMVNINKAPGFGNAEVYHPRWTNHPRFMALSGPYNQGGANQVRSGGKQSEVWLGRFSEDLTSIEGWVRATHNDGGDSYPDVWVERAKSPYPVRSATAVGPSTTAEGGAPGERGQEPSAARLVVEARLSTAGPIPSPQSIAPYRHALVVNTYQILKVLEGQYLDQRIRVAQWAIRDAQLLPGAQKTLGTVARLQLEPYDRHPELEGERLIAASDAPNMPLYYELPK